MAAVGGSDLESGEGKSASGHVEILGNDENAGEMVSLEKGRGVFRRGPSVEAFIVFVDCADGHAVVFQVMSHDVGFVVAFFSMGATDEDFWEIALMIKIESVVETGFKLRGGRAVGLNFVAEDDSEIGRVKIIGQTAENNGNAGDDHQAKQDKYNPLKPKFSRNDFHLPKKADLLRKRFIRWRGLLTDRSERDVK